MDIKKLFAAGCTTILALVLGTCGNTSASNGKDHLTDHASTARAAGEKFAIGLDPSFPPYGYEDEKISEYVGFDIDLAKEVTKRNEWEFVPQPINWGAKDMELNSGTVDCLRNGFTINGREDKYTQSKSYVNNSIVFATKITDRIADTKGLAGKYVLVQANPPGLTALESKDNKDSKDSLASLDQVPDYNRAFMDMESGIADAVAMDVRMTNFQAQTYGKGKFTIMNSLFHIKQYGTGLRKGNESLCDQAQKALDEMKADSTSMKLARKHAVEKSIIED